MAKSSKGSNRIVLNDVEYRWRATGNDGWISVTIWPSNGVGAAISCAFGYHETYEEVDLGHRVSRRDQIVITNRLIRRVIHHSIGAESYDPAIPRPELTIRNIEQKIDWSDAVRASDCG